MFSRSRRHDRHNRLQTSATANAIGSVLDSSRSSNREAFATGHTTSKSPSNKRAIGSGSVLLDEYDEFDESQDKQEKQLVSHNYHDHSNIQASQHPQRKKCGRGGVAKPFPLKLYHMLQQVDKEDIADIISWQPHGRCFHVRKPKAFVSQVLHRFFQQKKLASFQRQLNLYGFNRITAGPDKGSYYHEFFLRGKGFLIQNIYRIKVKGTGARLASNPDAEPNFYDMPFLDEEEEEEEDQLQCNDVEDFDNAVTTAATTTTTATPQLENTGRFSNPEEGTKVVDSREDTAVSASTYALPDSSKSRPSKRRSSLSSRRRRSIEALMKEMPDYGETMINQSQHEMPPLSSSATTRSSRIDYTSPYFNNSFGETMAPLPFNTTRTQQRRRSSLLSLSNYILDGFMNSARSSSSSSATYGGGVRRGSAGSFHHQDYNNTPTAAPAAPAFSYPSLQYDPASTNRMTESRSPEDFYRKEQQLSPELLDLMMLSNRQDLPLGGGSFHPY